MLQETRLPSQRLELEITESVILSQDQATYQMLTELRRLGVRFSMDDFGTGYSSLSSLNSFRFDKIKLDQSFVGTSWSATRPPRSSMSWLNSAAA